ncbi:MAG: hypothetical protein ABMB14_40470 [Myxococcota bacterium]
MAIAAWMMVLAGGGARADDEITDPLLLGETAGWWLETNVSAPVAVLVAPPTRDVLVTIDCRAQFGPLEYHWALGPYDLSSGTSIEVAIAPPPEAFQHPLATTYVTDLVEPTLLDGRPAQEFVLPIVFAIWPDGVDRDPVVWSEQELATHAPGGTLDPALIAEATANGPTYRYLPPIWHEYATPRGVDDHPEVTVTVPEDDQSDEVGR